MENAPSKAIEPEKDVPKENVLKESLLQEGCQKEQEDKRQPEKKEPETEVPDSFSPGPDYPFEYEAVPGSPSLLPYKSLISIGINVQLGLDYCCGEEEFYLEMLRMFCSQAKEKKAEIISLYDAANWADYTVKVHALKSTSLTIGAERLADQAKLLEEAGKKRNLEYIRHGHSALLRLYDEICDTLAGL